MQKNKNASTTALDNYCRRVGGEGYREEPEGASREGHDRDGAKGKGRSRDQETSGLSHEARTAASQGGNFALCVRGKR